MSTDKRPTLLAAGLFVLLLIICSVPLLGYYFSVLVKPFSITASIMGVVAVWFFPFGPSSGRIRSSASWVWKITQGTGSR